MTSGKDSRAALASGDSAGTKQQRVYEALRQRIIDGTYAAGFRIVIDAVSQELEVSTFPVREAVRRLEAEGLVTYIPNRGARVAPTSFGAYDDDMVVIAVLEGYATALAAASITEDDVEKLRAINDQMIDAMERMDSLTFAKHRHDFHDFIHRCCPNSSVIGLLHQVERGVEAVRPTVLLQLLNRSRALVGEHLDIIELLSRNAPFEEIEQVAREHKLKTLASFRAWRIEHGIG